jgi:hypothetical protein
VTKYFTSAYETFQNLYILSISTACIIDKIIIGAARITGEIIILGIWGNGQCSAIYYIEYIAKLENHRYCKLL